MMRQMPIILGVLALVGLTVAEARMSGRFEGSDITEEQFAAMLKNVPLDIGDWHGTDQPVGEIERQTAGARGYVSREYKNAITGEAVGIWLIVGHAKDIMRHTPDVCYPSSGFIMRAPENSLQSFVFDGKEMGDFLHQHFREGRRHRPSVEARLLVVAQAVRRRHRGMEGPQDRPLGIWQCPRALQAVLHQQHARLAGNHRRQHVA